MSDANEVITLDPTPEKEPEKASTPPAKPQQNPPKQGSVGATGVTGATGHPGPVAVATNKDPTPPPQKGLTGAVGPGPCPVGAEGEPTLPPPPADPEPYGEQTNPAFRPNPSEKFEQVPGIYETPKAPEPPAAKPHNFYTWAKQVPKGDLEGMGAAGDFVRDALVDPNFPKNAHMLAVILTYLQERRVDQGVLDSAIEAYTAYEKHNK